MLAAGGQFSLVHWDRHCQDLDRHLIGHPLLSSPFAKQERGWALLCQSDRAMSRPRKNDVGEMALGSPDGSPDDFACESVCAMTNLCEIRATRRTCPPHPTHAGGSPEQQKSLAPCRCGSETRLLPTQHDRAVDCSPSACKSVALSFDHVWVGGAQTFHENWLPAAGKAAGVKLAMLASSRIRRNVNLTYLTVLGTMLGTRLPNAGIDICFSLYLLKPSSVAQKKYCLEKKGFHIIAQWDYPG